MNQKNSFFILKEQFNKKTACPDYFFGSLLILEDLGVSQESLWGAEDDLGVNMTESKESIRSLGFHFRIVVKESEIRFWIQESGMGFPKKHILYSYGRSIPRYNNHDTLF